MSRPIFIGGCPRSGTSFLSHTLGRHHNILSYLEPAGFYGHVFKHLLRFPIPFFLFKELFARKMSRVIPYSASQQEIPEGRDLKEFFTKDRIKEKMSIFDGCRVESDYIERYAGFAESLFGEFARLCGMSRWCLKDPYYLFKNIDLIYRIHPDMKFIHIVRDGRDVISSIKQQSWDNVFPDMDIRGVLNFVRHRIGQKTGMDFIKPRRDRFAFALGVWLQNLTKGIERSKGIPEDNLITVRLEDLINSPDTQLERVCSFIGEDYDENMKIFVKQKITGTSQQRWKKDLTPEQAEIILQRGKHLLERYGYL